MLNSSPCFAVGRHFLYRFYFHHELGSFRGCKFLPPMSGGSRTYELSPLAKLRGWWRNLRRWYRYSFLGCPFGGPPDVFGYSLLWRKVQRQVICSDSIQSRSATYLLCKTRTSGANAFGHFLFVYFLFLKASLFYTGTYRTFFIGTAFDLPSTFSVSTIRVCSSYFELILVLPALIYFYYIAVWLQRPSATHPVH